MEGEVRGVFMEPSAVPAMSRKLAAQALHDVKLASARFKQLRDEGLGTLCTALRPRLRGLLDPLAGKSAAIRYELTEAEYAKNEDHYPFLDEFKVNAVRLMEPFEGHLTSTNYSVLILRCVGVVVRRLEGVILKKRFNQMGGMQFGRDVRSMSQFFTRWHDRVKDKAENEGFGEELENEGGAGEATSVRHLFKRLLQVAAVLGVDGAKDALDYCRRDGAGRGGSGLSRSDVRKSLALRVDFDTQDIDELGL
jgi:hypothetical protein